jgi:hypothetical protein
MTFVTINRQTSGMTFGGICSLQGIEAKKRQNFSLRNTRI